MMSLSARGTVPIHAGTMKIQLPSSLLSRTPNKLCTLSSTPCMMQLGDCHLILIVDSNQALTSKPWMPSVGGLCSRIAIFYCRELALSICTHATCEYLQNARRPHTG